MASRGTIDSGVIWVLGFGFQVQACSPNVLPMVVSDDDIITRTENGLMMSSSGGRVGVVRGWRWGQGSRISASKQQK